MKFTLLVTALSHLPRCLAAVGVAGAFTLGALLPLTTSSAAPVANAASLAGCNGNVQCIISFGDQRISDRLSALSTLSSKSTAQLNAGRITSDQNATIQGDVTTNQNDLNTLKSKLDAETTATAARQDVLSIYVTYRIYAVVLPRDYREIVLDIMTHIDGNLRAHQSDIQQAISQAPASEQAHLNALFSDFQSQLTNAESQLDAASSQIPSLTPQNYDSNRSAFDTAFQNYKDDEQTAHTDLKNAINDLHQIAQILKSNMTPTPSA